MAVWTFTTLFEGRQGSQEWVFFLFFFPIHVAEDFFETITTHGNTNLNSTEEYQVTLLTLFPKGAKEINRIFKSNILQGHGPEASSDCHYPWEYDHNFTTSTKEYQMTLPILTTTLSFKFTVQRPFQTISRRIELPLEMQQPLWKPAHVWVCKARILS